jgi:hypothetical protein
MGVPMIPSDFMRAMHRALLLNCGIEATHEFWAARPLVVDGVALGPVEVARHLARDDQRVPLSWACDSMNALEEFLVEREVPFVGFVDSMLLHANRGSFVSSRLMLLAFGPLLAVLFRLTDPHHLFFRMFTLGGGKFFPGLLFDEVVVENLKPDDRRAIVLFGFRALWEGLVSGWDGDVFGAHLLRQMPMSLGLQPFAQMLPLSDARSAFGIAGHSSRTSVQGDQFLIDGEVFGQLMRFDAYCATRGIQLRDHGQPNSDVVVMTRSYTCPRRRRIVLNAGCAYGAPFYLLEARWRLQADRIHTVFQHFIHEALTGSSSAEAVRAAMLEVEFGAAHELEIVCTFRADDESVSVGAQHVCQGVPAKILLACLRAHVGDGRTHFAFREFKRDRALISSSKNTGFETRLRRLRDALENANVGIRIESTGRGRFALRHQGRIRLVEEASTAGSATSLLDGQPPLLKC